MGGRYCAINSPLGPRWGKILDLRSRDFCPHLEPRGELFAQYRPPMLFRYITSWTFTHHLTVNNQFNRHKVLQWTTFVCYLVSCTFRQFYRFIVLPNAVEKYPSSTKIHRQLAIAHIKYLLYIKMHYDDIIMGAMASQITSLTIVYSTAHSGADQRKHQSSASLAFVRGIPRWPVNSPHKWPVTRKKCFHLMTSSW